VGAGRTWNLALLSQWLFDLKYVPLGRVTCIPKSKTFNSFIGLPPWLSEVLLVCVLRPVFARGFPSWASRVTWVVSRVSKLALTAPVVSELFCVIASPALPFGEKLYIPAVSPNMKEINAFISC
jgi:hypothetical protein